MQAQEYGGSVERRILIACITCTQFLGRIAGRLGKEPFASSESSLVYSWCAEYFQKYRTAPGKQIESVFSQWANVNKSELRDLVERLLSSLSGQYEREEEQNEEVEFLVDLAGKHFNQVALSRLQEKIRSQLGRGDVDGALLERESFRRVDLRSPPSVELLRDEAVWERALSHKQKVLIHHPGAAGQFFGEEFSEDSFIGVMAQSKGGKSWTLLDIAWRGVLQGRKIAYFQVGDLSLDQVVRRFLKRAAYRPLRPEVIRFPTGILLPAGHQELAVVEWESKTYERPLSLSQARAGFQRVLAKSKGDIRISYHPIRTVNTTHIKSILDRWDEEGWVANVVIVDYAGNLAPIDNKANTVDQVSLNWAMLRQLSEIRKCLVVTANQSNKEGFKTWVLTRSHFAESKMILAHVTAFLGVNMTEEERSRKIIRYNFIVRREEEFRESYCLYCAASLDVGNPIVVSCLPGSLCEGT